MQIDLDVLIKIFIHIFMFVFVYVFATLTTLKNKIICVLIIFPICVYIINSLVLFFQKEKLLDGAIIIDQLKYVFVYIFFINLFVLKQKNIHKK